MFKNKDNNLTKLDNIGEFNLKDFAQKVRTGDVTPLIVNS